MGITTNGLCAVCSLFSAWDVHWARSPAQAERLFMLDAVSHTRGGIQSAQCEAGCLQFGALYLKTKVWGKSDRSKQQVNAIRGPEMLTRRNGLQLLIPDKKEHTPKIKKGHLKRCSTSSIPSARGGENPWPEISAKIEVRVSE